MTNGEKRYKALKDFDKELLQCSSKDDQVISAVRMNVWTMNFMVGDVLGRRFGKLRGEPDWPQGAFAYLGDPYGDAYIFVDNTLADGVFEIDMEPK